MPINDETFKSPAHKSDITGLAIKASLAMYQIAKQFELIQKGGVPSAEGIVHIRALAKDFSEIFDRLSGWTDE